MFAFPIPKLKTLRSQIALGSAILVFVTVSFHFLLTLTFWSQALEEQLTVLQSGLANEIAARLSPIFSKEGPVDFLAIQKIGNDYQEYNPNIDIYLLDENGGLFLALSRVRAPQVHSVRLEPILRQLNDKGPRLSLYRSTNPHQPERDVAFLAAPLSLGSKQGYVYITLVNVAGQSTNTLLFERMSFRYAASASCAVLLASLILSIPLSRFLTYRFNHVLYAIEEYRKGKLFVRIEDQGEDELGILANQVNTMAAAIEEKIGLLGRKDQLRRELIADVWHDIRNPLTIIRGQIESLEIRDQADNHDMRLEAYARIKRSALLLENLVLELKELAALEAKETQAKMDSLNIRLLFEELLADFTQKAEQNQVKISLTIANRDVFVFGDVVLLRRVFVNLIENAIRYTSPGGQITLGADERGSAYQLSICDTGLGIPQESLASIFERSYQSLEGEKSIHGAAGLGLAIVKRIVELHNSTILVQSAPGKGTMFSFELPKADLSQDSL